MPNICAVIVLDVVATKGKSEGPRKGASGNSDRAKRKAPGVGARDVSGRGGFGHWPGMPGDSSSPTRASHPVGADFWFCQWALLDMPGSLIFRRRASVGRVLPFSSVA
jgi:hypothetical protein